MNSPILLAGQVTILPGQSIEVPITQFQNPFNTAMYIDEVRFISSVTNPALILNIQAELTLGRLALTNGFVPVRCLGRVLNVWDAASASSLINATWKLPKPLYVGPQEPLVTKLYYDPTFTATNIGALGERTIGVVYAGRSLPSGHCRPKSIPVPWAAAFIAPVVASDTNSEISSTEADLFNPFRQPLRVQRFIGRSCAMTTGGELLNGQFSELTTVRAVDSSGKILVRDPTPFQHLFQIPSRTWTVNAVLDPSGFFIFTVDRDYDGYSYPDTTFAISMVGHREVELE